MNECYVYNAIILQNKELDTLTYEHIDEGWIGSCNSSNSYTTTKQKKYRYVELKTIRND